MTQHKPKWFRNEQDEQRRVSCLGCGQTSGWVESRQLAEDWWIKHEEEIERILANLRRPSPSPKNELAYYEKMAADPHTSPENKRLFEQLATEYRKRFFPEPTSEDVFLPGFG